MLWIDRTFEFDFPVDIYPEIINRLRSTPDRIEKLIQNIPGSTLTMRKAGKWSMQEHVGHLLNLEPLFMGRLDDFEAGAEILRPADMTNEANFNLKQVEKILSAFRQERGKLIRRLDGYPTEMFGKTALHPRLNKPMRLVDSLCFQAEHDDHHLTVMTGLSHFHG